MQSATVVKLSVLLLVCSSVIRWSEGAGLVLQFDHAFSRKGREQRFAQRQGDWPVPDPNTAEYHKFLLQHDHARHGRMLATAESYTFLEGNFTLQLFGGLYYATIDVGTPSVPFLVVLDTGSDLFWLPCECQSCAPASSPIYADYGITAPLNVYDPSTSNTSKPISCASDDCHLYINQCVRNGGGQCQYKANYASVNTSSSGKLVEDVIHLVPNSGEQTSTTVPIVLGCGQVQTGSFLDGFGAPDGLIGLGLQNFSVPASLAKSGLVKNSFSVCFDEDFSGRVVFGDLGSETQKITPFLPADPGSYETYFVGLESIEVGTESIPVGESALFDTGTTYTFLNSSTYQAFIASFVKQNTGYPRIPVDTQSIPWEACYLTSDDKVSIPSIDFVLQGNAVMPIKFPVVSLVYANRTRAGFCLAVIESRGINIIGANFMVGQNLVFNREKLTLGFEEANCYDVVANPGPSPSPVAGGPTPSPVRKPPPPSDTNTPGATPGGPVSSPSGASAPTFSLVILLSLGLVHLFV